MSQPTFTSFDIIAAPSSFSLVPVASANTDRFEMWRRFQEGEPFKLTDSLASPFTSYGDYNVPYGVLTEYWAVAIDDADGLQAVSESRFGTLSFGGIWLHEVGRLSYRNLGENGIVLPLVNLEGSQRSISVAVDRLHLPSQDRATNEISQTVQRTWQVPIKILDLTTTERSRLNTVKSLHLPVCMRDDRGRMMFGVLRDTKERLDLHGDYSLELVEVDYREGVI